MCVLQEEDFEYGEQFEGDDEEECCEYECVPLKSIFAGERHDSDESDDDDDYEVEKGGKLIQ